MFYIFKKKYKFNISFYILFLFFIIFFIKFSTVNANANTYKVLDLEISKTYDNNFNKEEVIDIAFKKAFEELILRITTTDGEEINKLTNLKTIYSLIESFSIVDEKFIDNKYVSKFEVEFSKKELFKYLEKKNIFPSIPLKKKFLFIPVIINESQKDLLIFNNNKVFDNWNSDLKSHYLIEYILPTDDLEDLNLIKNNFENIEKYNFREITNKYNLEHSIIALIFRNEKEVRVLSRITNKEKTILKNQTFSNLDLGIEKDINSLTNDLKLVYEDYWKSLNQINTSIKLNLNVKINNNNVKISSFEKILGKTDLVYNYYISKFDKEFTYYKIIFNGTPDTFLKNMNEANYNFNINNRIWTLK